MVFAFREFEHPETETNNKDFEKDSNILLTEISIVHIQINCTYLT